MVAQGTGYSGVFVTRLPLGKTVWAGRLAIDTNINQPSKKLEQWAMAEARNRWQSERNKHKGKASKCADYLGQATT